MATLKRAFEVLFIERRMPIAWSNAIQRSLYEIPLARCLCKVLTTRPVSCNPDAATELHMLTGTRDGAMSILALKSLLRFIPDLAVVIHGDGSLNDEWKSNFTAHVPGCRIVTRDEADAVASTKPAIRELRDKLPGRFALGKGFEHYRCWALKYFDLHLTSKTQRVVYLDSDTLFLQHPVEIVKWISADSPVPFFSVPFLPNLNVDRDLLGTAFPGVDIIDRINAGFHGFDASSLSLDLLAETAERILSSKEIPLYGDECLWRYAYSQIDHNPLCFELYPLFGTLARFRQFQQRSADFRYIHFLLKHRDGLYQRYASQVLRELE